MKDESAQVLHTSVVPVSSDGTQLTIAEYAYPNPSHRYGIFTVAEVVVGRADKAGDDGWILRGGRKARSARETLVAMLRAAVSDARARQTEAAADEKRAHQMLRSLLKPEV